MISVQEATHILNSDTFSFQEKKQVTILKSIGQILAEDIFADRDFPPFDRVAMDGIAFRMASFVSLEVGDRLLIEAIQYAGEPQKTLLNPEACIEVMTGAILPANTDTVIRYEDLTLIEENETKYFVLKTLPLKKGTNVHSKGSDQKKNDSLILKGQKISALEVAVLATVGKENVAVFVNHRIAIVSTGDELVSITSTPTDYQIRMSNSYMLASALEQEGFACDIYHFSDSKAGLLLAMKTVFEKHQLVITTGGVSMGKADYLPQVFQELGIEKQFHKIAQKPGKPFWFGKSNDNQHFVFALPGNPVSTLVGYLRYVLPFLRKKNTAFQVKMLENVPINAKLTLFLPVKIVSQSNGVFQASLVKNNGSGDFSTLVHADGFIEILASDSSYSDGQLFDYYSFR
ncbi:MAG: molybdopterin molybdotransferase MoeA [Pseudarcicella sp.]|nr:molybdopterin molybdotransferase MoeA [Pseudarcicella sp.]